MNKIKILSFILAVCFLLSLSVPGFALAPEDAPDAKLLVSNPTIQSSSDEQDVCVYVYSDTQLSVDTITIQFHSADEELTVGTASSPIPGALCSDSAVSFSASSPIDLEYNPEAGGYLIAAIPVTVAANAVGTFKLQFDLIDVADMASPQIDFDFVDNVPSRAVITVEEPQLEPEPEPEPVISSISLDRTELTMVIGESEVLVASVLPDGAVNPPIEWTSSAPDVVKVEDGLVTAVSAGEALVTARAGEVKASCSITVTEGEPTVVEVEEITLDKSSLTLEVGGSAELTATVKPRNATDGSVYWVSSDTEVVTVSDGTVTAVSAGSAVITARAGEKRASCDVTVTEAAGEDPGEDPGEDSGEDPGEEPGEDPGEDSGEDPDDDNGESSSEESIKYGLRESEIDGYVIISFEDYGVRRQEEIDAGDIEPEFVRPLGIIVSQREVPFCNGDSIADVTVRLLDELGWGFDYTGRISDGFYLAAIQNFTVRGVRYSSFGEFDAGRDSGWMITWNNWFIDASTAAFKVNDGDIIRWQYTCQLGNDIGASFGDEESESGAAGDNSSGSSELIRAYDGDTVVIRAQVDHSEGGAAYAADATLTKEVAAEALEKAMDKSKLKLWVDIQDSNRLVLKIEAETVDVIASVNAGLRVECSKGMIELDSDAVAKLSDTGGEVRITISYDDWYDEMRLSVTADHKLMDVMMKVELPAPNAGQALTIINSDSTHTVIKKSAIVNGRMCAMVPSGNTVQIVDSDKLWDDVKESDWFSGAVDFAFSHELMQGVDKRAVFAPNDPMTRAMLVTVLWRLEDELESSGGVSFSDVDADQWYSGAVAWAAEESIVLGNGDGFDPNGNLTREQIATILYRYVRFIGLDTSESGDMSKFNDGDTVSPWAQEAMAWALKVGLFKGDDTGSLNPQGNATRAEVATLLMRLIKLIVK